jgi:hypothetical protein
MKCLEEIHMKKVVVIMTVSSVLGLGLALDAFAQTRPPAPTDRPPSTDRPAAADPKMGTPGETFQNTHGYYESSTIIGARVKNAKGKDIGEID